MKDGYVLKKNRKGTEYIEDENGEAVAKRCTVCGGIKELHCFYSQKRGFLGKHSQCIGCKGESHKIYYAENKEDLRKYKQKHYRENKEYYTEYNKEWVKENKGYRKNYYEENKDREKEYDKRWRKANPEKVRLKHYRRRTLKRSLPSTLTAEQDIHLKELQNHICIITGIGDCYSLETNRTLYSIEHFIPLNWGVGGTTFENCYYMYLPLNSSKQNKNPFEWIKTQPEDYQERFHTLLVPMMAERNGMTVEEFTSYVYQCEPSENPVI